MDVFNALDLMDNEQFLQTLKFGIGDGNLQYYVYNWKCPSMLPKKVNILFNNNQMIFIMMVKFIFVLKKVALVLQ
jgi:hypothetical protein